MGVLHGGVQEEHNCGFFAGLCEDKDNNKDKKKNEYKDNYKYKDKEPHFSREVPLVQRTKSETFF